MINEFFIAKYRINNDCQYLFRYILKTNTPIKSLSASFKLCKIVRVKIDVALSLLRAGARSLSGSE